MTAQTLACRSVRDWTPTVDCRSTLNRAADGAVALEGRGEPVEWLVHMRRLPAEHMLDAVLTSGRAINEEASLRAAARHLATFFLNACAEPISGAAYRHVLEQGTQMHLGELSEPRFRLPRDRVETLARAQLAFLKKCGAIFDRRVDAERIIDGQGDLRPEHVCVRPEPAVIDCLEFAKELRVLDPADEIAFLDLECERSIVAFERLPHGPDVLLFDGHRVAHPLSGLACRAGVLFAKPSVGCVRKIPYAT